MGQSRTSVSGLSGHGAENLPTVVVDSYNLELRDQDGFVGDRASRRAFHDILENWRKTLRGIGDDPLGEKPSDEISKKKLDALLTEGDPEAAGLIHSAIEEFAGELTAVISRFLKTPAWRGTEAIVLGGGFRASRVGELVMGRAALLLKEAKHKVTLALIQNDPDEAGLIGAAHLVPAWMLEGFDGLLAVDIGGTNIRAGVVETNIPKDANMAKATVWKSILWRHGDEETSRDKAVDRLVDMLKQLIKQAAKAKLKLAPLIAIGCPGRINEDGSIEAGAQNLPGNWESSRFNLADCIRAAIPEIGSHETSIIIHNDAVVQGLSEFPAMMEYRRWGVLTIGTGLGNARFTNRQKEQKEKKS